MNFPGFALLREGVRRLMRQDPQIARGAVDTVAKRISGAVPHAKDELWVCADGRVMRIGEMDRDHLVHSLAMIMREARHGRVWVMSPGTGQLVKRSVR